MVDQGDPKVPQIFPGIFCPSHGSSEHNLNPEMLRRGCHGDRWEGSVGPQIFPGIFVPKSPPRKGTRIRICGAGGVIGCPPTARGGPSPGFAAAERSREGNV